jgi:hypothetical protein
MEKILKNISRRNVLKLGLVGLAFAGCSKKNPLSPIQENDTKNSNSKPFEFSVSESKISPYEESNLGIKKVEWENNTLNVKAYVAINCAEEITRGNYKLSKDNITLTYTCPKCVICTTCMETNELNYKFTNLEKKDYEFELKRLEE